MTPTGLRTAIIVVVLAGLAAHPASWAAAQQAGPALGLFSGSQDIGTPSTIGAGSASHDAQKQAYVVSGGGANMWGTADQFHYVWKKVSGDVTLAATIEFTGTMPATGHRIRTAKPASSSVRRWTRIRCTRTPPCTATA